MKLILIILLAFISVELFSQVINLDTPVDRSLNSDTAQYAITSGSGGSSCDTCYVKTTGDTVYFDKETAPYYVVTTDSNQSLKFTEVVDIEDVPMLELNGDLSYKMRHIFAEYTPAYTPAVTEDLYTKIKPTFVSTEVSFMTFAGDSITIINNGDYHIVWNFTISGGSGDDYTFQIRKNNAVVKSGRCTATGTTNYDNITIQYYLQDLVAGDAISFWVTNTQDNDDPTFTDMDFYIEKKHN